MPAPPVPGIQIIASDSVCLLDFGELRIISACLGILLERVCDRYYLMINGLIGAFFSVVLIELIGLYGIHAA